MRHRRCNVARRRPRTPAGVSDAAVWAVHRAMAHPFGRAQSPAISRLAAQPHAVKWHNQINVEKHDLGRTVTLGVSADPRERNVWDNSYVNAAAMTELDTNTDGTTDRRLYPAWDANFNVVSLVAPHGHSVERYVWQPYGNDPNALNGQNSYEGAALVLNGDGDYEDGNEDDEAADWTYDWTGTDYTDFHQGFQGMRYDPDSATYITMTRRYLPGQGTFDGRDPLGTAYQDGMNLGQFEGLNPLTHLDPNGTALITNFVPAGQNHFYPLYLGGSNSQPVAYLTQAEHMAFHQYIENQGLGFMGKNGDLARLTWSEMSVSERINAIMSASGPNGANLSSTELDTLIERMPDIFAGDTAGEKTLRGTLGEPLWECKATDSLTAGIAAEDIEAGIGVADTLQARLVPIESSLAWLFLLERVTLGVMADAKENHTSYLNQLKTETNNAITRFEDAWDYLNSFAPGASPRGAI